MAKRLDASTSSAERRRDMLAALAFPVCWVAVGAWLFFSGASIEAIGSNDAFGPGSFPQIIGGLLVVCGIWLAVGELRARGVHSTAPPDAVPDRSAEDAGPSDDDAHDPELSLVPEDHSAWRPFLVIGITAGYVLLLPVVGFVPATIVGVCVIATVTAREFRWKLALLYPVLVTALVYLLFSNLLGIRLP